MVDFHSHILPQIDDGSKSVEESFNMLTMLREQGVSLVAATPHFDANATSVHRFIEKRAAAYDKLAAKIGDTLPCVHLGAEVQFYPGISRLEGLERLCFEGTRVLLLEMPFCRWTPSLVQELLSISNTSGLTVVLAHIERYLKWQRKGVLEELLNNGIYIQVNASFFIERRTRRRALKMLSKQEIHLLGSDCHGEHVRPPRMDEAIRVIRKSLGDKPLEMIFGCATDLLSV